MNEGTAVREHTEAPHAPRLSRCPRCSKWGQDHHHALHFVRNTWVVTDWHYSCRPGECEAADQREGVTV